MYMTQQHSIQTEEKVQIKSHKKSYKKGLDVVIPLPTLFSPFPSPLAPPFPSPSAPPFPSLLAPLSVGIDVSKLKLDICVLDTSSTVLETCQVANTEKGIQEL